MANGDTTPDVSMVIADPNFQSLGLDEKHKVMLKVDKNYAGLPAKEQAKALEQIGYPQANTSPSTQADDSWVRGAWRGISEPIKGAYQAITTPPQSPTESFMPPGVLEGYRMAKGAVGAEVEAGKQAEQQLSSGMSARSPGQFARGVVTAASMFNPFATGSVVGINKLKDEGRMREAIGTGAVDILILLMGGRMGKEPTAETRLAKLTTASGETGTTAVNYRTLMPDIMDAVRTKGKPKTIGDLHGIAHDTLGGLEDQFQAALNKQVPVPQQAGLVQQEFVPQRGSMAVGDMSATPREIAQSLRDKITPNMRKTAEGRADIAEIEAAAQEFERPWSIRELDAERKTRGSKLNAFYNKDSAGRSTAARSHVQTLIDKTVRDGAANIVYKAVDLGNPGMDATALKLKEKAAMKLDSQLKKRTGKLEDAQLAHEGKSFTEKLKAHAYVAASGVRAHLPLGGLIPGKGPLGYANANIKAAFGPSTGAVARRAAVLSLPLERLAGEQTQRKDLPPPPEPAEAPEP